MRKSRASAARAFAKWAARAAHDNCWPRAHLHNALARSLARACVVFAGRRVRSACGWRALRPERMTHSSGRPARPPRARRADKSAAAAAAEETLRDAYQAAPRSDAGAHRRHHQSNLLARNQANSIKRRQLQLEASAAELSLLAADDEHTYCFGRLVFSSVRPLPSRRQSSHLSE